ncbi:MAG: hypothetical protein CM15mP102_16050 [Flavobacteriales bacterium]|nr:MAG: hypothetical protein CM15mP102_16050 [Flavobacteriales bacterium]
MCWYFGTVNGSSYRTFCCIYKFNDTIPRYIKEGIYEPLKTKSTISNAMDVSEPSNFIRIQKILIMIYRKLEEYIWI